jgi:hypothetical protein
MGVPHRGHIDYISRVLELGFHVRISLQRSYTITRRDPYPKWLVMKMVAQSLFDRGFGPDHFDFLFTPFYRTHPELQLHFAMMPGRDDVVAIASGNPEVHALFPALPIIDQRVVFGVAGESYQTRSWGAQIRAAIRQGDQETFEALAASGVERILSFGELRRSYAETPVELVRRVIVVLRDGRGRELVRGRVRRYLSAEESLVWLLNQSSRESESSVAPAHLVDPYAREARVRVDGCPGSLRYVGSEVAAEVLTVSFRLDLTQPTKSDALL